MRRFLVPGLATLAVFALLALLAYGVSNQGPNSSLDAALARGIHPPAPEARMALPLLGRSGRLSLADLRGKVVVINVFASWCDPCKAEAPVLEQAERQIAGRDATVLGVTYLDNSSDSQRFVQREHITYPVLRDVSGNFVRGFEASGVPETYVIDRRGHIAAIRRFQVTSAWLESVLPPVLAGRA